MLREGPLTSGAKQPPASSVLIAIGVILSAIFGLVSNVIAAYLQEQYHLISDPMRLLIVFGVLLISLSFSIVVAVRSNRG
jgi:hypothetical protein